MRNIGFGGATRAQWFAVCAATMSSFGLSHVKPALAQSVVQGVLQSVVRRGSPSALQVDTTFALRSGALLDISVREGTVLVRGTAQRTAEVHANASAFTVRASGAGVTVAASAGGRAGANGFMRSRGNDDARLEIVVPRGVRVLINAGRADVTVRDLDDDIEVRTSTGDIRVERPAGRTITETLTGDTRIDDGAVSVRARSVSGDIIVHGVREEATLQSTSGSITIDGAALQSVTAESISGDLSFAGGLTDEGRLSLSTHSGDVLLRIPAAMRGSLDFVTHAGDLHTDIPLTMTGVPDDARRDGLRDTRVAGGRASQHFVLNGGGRATLSVSSFSGDVRIERASSRLRNH